MPPARGPHDSASIDDVDRRLIAALADDARASVTDIAGALNISRATAYSRLERLRTAGVIRGFSAVVDHERMGLGVTALILVTGSQREWQANERAIRELPEVEYAWFVAGSADIVLLVRVADSHQLRELILARLQRLPGITATQTLFVIEEITHRPVVGPVPGG